jgi:hypothetical protein
MSEAVGNPSIVSRWRVMKAQIRKLPIHWRDADFEQVIPARYPVTPSFVRATSMLGRLSDSCSSGGPVT